MLLTHPIMKKAFIRSAQVFSLTAATLLVAPSCTKDLDRTPAYDLSADLVYKDAAGYKTQLAKVYSGLAVTGPNGPDATSGDIIGINQGFSDYVRQLWSAQEMTTDEAVVAWGDDGVQDWHNMNWTSNAVLIRGMYSRFLYEITICNSYLQESTPDKLAARGLTAAEAADVAQYRAEVRFIRALAYYHSLDLFGNVPFLTEADPIGTSTLPKQTTRAALYTYLEGELKAIAGDATDKTDILKDARQNEYGRADKGAAYALLAKMYLNGVTYAGASAAPACYTNAATYAKKIIDNPNYKLLGNSTTGTRLGKSGYSRLFLADNDKNNTEVIFPIVYDGKFTQTYGGTTFLTHAAVSNLDNINWSTAAYGIAAGDGWGGIRATKRLFQQFPDTAADLRGRFHTKGQTLEIDVLTNFKYGYVPIKFANVTSTGTPGSDPKFVDTDYPMFRLADMYLTYAEAYARGGTADAAVAAECVKKVRNRAFGGVEGGSLGNVPTDSISSGNVRFFLRERSRELYWEATRRTDLIRFGLYTRGYNWPWKGGAENGVDVADYRSLFPIPASDLSINTNLVHNTGY
jgi:hypothetical protein